MGLIIYVEITSHYTLCVCVCVCLHHRQSLLFADDKISTDIGVTLCPNKPPHPTPPLLPSHTPHSGMITLTMPPSVHCGKSAGCTIARGKRLREKKRGAYFLLYTAVQTNESLTLCFWLFSSQLLLICDERIPTRW